MSERGGGRPEGTEFSLNQNGSRYVSKVKNAGEWRMLAGLLFSLFLQGVPAQDTANPLPDLSTFVREIRSHLRSDRLLLSQYAYNLKQTEIEYDNKSRPKKTTVRVYEVYPSLDEGLTYERLISKNGVPVTSKELEKQDNAYDRKVKEHARKLQREGSTEKDHRVAKEAEEQRKEDAVIDEIFQMYDITMIGRENLDGRPAIHLAFRPRKDYKPNSREAGFLMKMAGNAWIGEEDHQLIRLQVELIDTLSIGLGVLARLNKGATLSFERRRVNDEIWLPGEARFAGTARVLLLKGLRIESISEFSEYRKFSVTSSATRPVPKK